jgi:hypothetical protein
LQQVTARRLLGHAGVGHRQSLALASLDDRHAIDLSDPRELKRVDRLLVGQRRL